MCPREWPRIYFAPVREETRLMNKEQQQQYSHKESLKEYFKKYASKAQFLESPLFLRSEKLQNESSPNFSNFRPEFCPEFCSEFSPNFSRTFRASFRGRRRPEKIHQKSPPFFNAKFPGEHEKNIHKILLESRQRSFFCRLLKARSQSTRET